MKLRVPLAGFVLAGMAVSCGGGRSVGTGTPGTPTSQRPVAACTTITVTECAFLPPACTLKPGEKVKFHGDGSDREFTTKVGGVETDVFTEGPPPYTAPQGAPKEYVLTSGVESVDIDLEHRKAGACPEPGTVAPRNGQINVGSDPEGLGEDD